jgi:hypothetical protein
MEAARAKRRQNGLSPFRHVFPGPGPSAGRNCLRYGIAPRALSAIRNPGQHPVRNPVRHIHITVELLEKERLLLQGTEHPIAGRAGREMPLESLHLRIGQLAVHVPMKESFHSSATQGFFSPI